MAKVKTKAAKGGIAVKQVGIRATFEWAEWLERAAKFCRTDTAKLIDAALIDFLRAKGFEEEAPPRL